MHSCWIILFYLTLFLFFFLVRHRCLEFGCSVLLLGPGVLFGLVQLQNGPNESEEREESSRSKQRHEELAAEMLGGNGNKTNNKAEKKKLERKMYVVFFRIFIQKCKHIKINFLYKFTSLCYAR